MWTIASFAATAILLCAPFGFALAQNTPDSGSSAAPATTTAPSTAAAPAPPAPAAETAPPNAPAPEAQSVNPTAVNPTAPNPPSAGAPAAAEGTPKDTAAKDTASKTKKKKAAGITRRHEIERSIESGTVPSRYPSSVPKEYQQYIPFSKD
jgi:hypothetical protein